MSAFTLLLLTAQFPTFSQAVDRAARIVDASKSSSVSVAVQTNYRESKASSKFEIVYQRPDAIRINIQEPEQNGLDRTNRTYLISKSRVVGVDYGASEYLTRRPENVGTLAERATKVVGELGEPFDCAVTGIGLKSVMWRFARMGSWSSKPWNGGRLFSATNRTTKATLKVAFQQDGRLSSVELKQDPDLTIWKFSYRPGSKPQLQVPASFKRVDQFTARGALPKFGDAAARKLVETSAARYDSLNQYVVDVEGATNFKMWVSGRDIRYESGSVTWVYRSGAAKISDGSNRRFFTGKVSSGEMIEALSAAGFSAPPFARYALLRFNPVRSLLTKEFQVRSIGSMTIAGSNINMIEARSAYWRGTMDFESKSKLLWQVTVNTVDSSGKTVSRSSTKLSYKSIGMPVGKGAFELQARAGQRSGSIRTLLKKKP